MRQKAGVEGWSWVGRGGVALGVVLAAALVALGCANGGSQADALEDPTDAEVDASEDQSTDTSPPDVSTDDGAVADAAPDADADAADASDATDAPDADADAPAGCVDDGDCTGSPLGAFCDAPDGGVGKCVACVPWNDQCPAGEWCAPQKICKPGCKDTSECVASPADGGVEGGSADGGDGGDGGSPLVCDPGTHRCVGCLADDDCPAGALCDVPSSSCIPGCTAQHACQSGRDCCAGQCTNTQVDLENCGTCSNGCVTPDHGKPACVGGTCGLGACTSGWADCNSSATDGCETDILDSNANCGGCGTLCAPDHGQGACVLGKCTVTSCVAPFADCNGDPSDGCEANLATDGANCGTCSKACLVTHGAGACSGGSCVVDHCDIGFGDCNTSYADGCETNTATSLVNCGGCGTPCNVTNGTPLCSKGVCTVAACTGSFRDCNTDPTDGCETDITSAADHCGSCATACQFTNGGAACTGGTCALAACTPGWGDCDGDSSTGCETNTRNDVNNCSGCGVSCNLAHSSPTCTNGACQIAACSSPWEDCNGVAFDGCEVNLQKDKDNCGGCGTRCFLPNSTAACTTGSCAVASCNNGFADCDKAASNGCEVNTQTDLQNCGGCGKGCSITNGVPNCSGGSCQVGACNGSWKDCNGSSFDGCEIDTSTSLNNCGACGSKCNFPNGTASCDNGTCEIVTCKPGFANCNGDLADGCETPTNTPANCGGCGIACNPANGTGNCTSGTCVVTACSSGWTDCDGNSGNGCETQTSSDIYHCGACTNSVCTTANGGSACVSGHCTVGSCGTGFADCNNNPSDGCESNLQQDVNRCGNCATQCSVPAHALTAACTGGSCGIGTCQTGWTDCNNSRTDGCEKNTAADPNNCGLCGRVCQLQNANVACSSGTCAVASCSAGWNNCDNDPSNGCESFAASDVNNCGVCGKKCTSTTGTPICSAGTCAVTNCPANTADCNGNSADGCETSTGTDTNNCGSCGKVCSLPNALTTGCTSGSCTIVACKSGFADCNSNPADGCEVDLNSRPDHCGTCVKVCALPNTSTNACTNGTCAVQQCAAGYGDCNGTASDGCEKSLLTDANNCSVCGKVCAVPNAIAACVAGSCTTGSCNTGFGSCDGNGANGCETNLKVDPNNCGTCGKVCGASLPNAGNATWQCTNGGCAIVACNPGFLDCNGNPVDGCEVNLKTDAANCGGCGNTCQYAHAPGTCSNGTCQIGTCSSGWGNCDGNPANGCETNLTSSVNACGSCNNTCGASLSPVGGNANWSCANSTCVVTSCKGIYGDCNGSAADGCEAATNTVANCGSCGNACRTNLPQTNATCGGSSCSYSCVAGNYDMNKDTTTTSSPSAGANGCECDTPDSAPDSCSSGVPSISFSGTSGAVSGSLASAVNGSGVPTDVDWYQVSFPGATSCAWHASIALDATSVANGVRIEVDQSACGTLLSGNSPGSGSYAWCGASGDQANSASLAQWESAMRVGCGYNGVADTAPDNTGAFFYLPTKYFVKVFATASTSTCDKYTLTVKY